MFKIILVIFILFLITPFLIYSQDKPPVIEVKGNAEIKIEPNIMEMFINVNVDNDDLQNAKNENDESTNKVLTLLKGLNVDDNDIVTTGIRMARNYDTYNKRKKYTVTNNILIKTSKISLYEDITSELIRIDNVFLSDINVTSTKIIETRKQAREDALLAAKKKADEMAAIYEMAVGKPVLIEENPVVNYPNPFNAVTLNREGQDMDISQVLFKTGLVSVTASVKVVFLLVDK